MSKLFTISSLILLWAGAALAGDVTLGHAIDLDQPGVLELLQRSNPEHYEKVRNIVAGSLRSPMQPSQVGCSRISLHVVWTMRRSK